MHGMESGGYSSGWDDNLMRGGVALASVKKANAKPALISLPHSIAGFQYINQSLPVV